MYKTNKFQEKEESIRSEQFGIDPNRSYPIGEAAKLVGRDRSTLLRYTKRYPKIFPHTESIMGGRKMFKGDLLLKLKMGQI